MARRLDLADVSLRGRTARALVTGSAGLPRVRGEHHPGDHRDQHPTRAALDRVLTFLTERLRS